MKVPKTLIKVKVNNVHFKKYVGYSRLKPQLDHDGQYRFYVSFPEVAPRCFFDRYEIEIIERCYAIIYRNGEGEIKKKIPKSQDDITEIWEIVKDLKLIDLCYSNIPNLAQQGYLRRIK